MRTDDPLSKLLHEWKVATPLPLGMQDQVWHRIERANTRQAPWVLILRQVSSLFTRPALAAGYVTFLLVAGLAAGYWQARAANAQVDVQLSSRYVQMIDPYRNSHR
jgi:hypothetical protein